MSTRGAAGWRRGVPITHELLDRLRKGRDGECSTQAADHRRLEHAYRRHVWWWAPHEEDEEDEEAAETSSRIRQSRRRL